jgi:hypothetical protein
VVVVFVVFFARRHDPSTVRKPRVLDRLVFLCGRANCARTWKHFVGYERGNTVALNGHDHST